MRAKNFISLLVLISFILISCDKENERIDITDSCEFYDNILSTCFYGSSGSEYDEIVFRNNNAFQDFGNIIRIYPANVDCDTAKLPNIDFSKYSLLSKRTNGLCSATYARKVLKDIDNKKIIYKISVTYEGSCEMLVGSRNWAIVPKIPDDYNVEFQQNDYEN